MSLTNASNMARLAPSSLLSLPDSALYTIFHFLAEGDGSSYNTKIDELDDVSPHRWRDFEGPDSGKVVFNHARAVIVLSSCCRRLNELYRTRVRDVTLSGVYPPDACARICARFPAVRSLSLFCASSIECSTISDPKNLAQVGVEARFICDITPRGLKSLTVMNTPLHVATLRHVFEKCTGLEFISLPGCGIFTDTSSQDTTHELCDLSLATHGSTLKELGLRKSYFGSVHPLSQELGLPVTEDMYFDLRWFSPLHLVALETLSIVGLNLSFECYLMVGAMPNLKYLDMSRSNVCDVAATFLLPELTNLLTLDISRCYMLKDVQTIPLPPRLEELEVSETLYFGAVDSMHALSAAPATLETQSFPTELIATACNIDRVDYFLHHAADILVLDFADSHIRNSADLSRLLQRTTQLEELNLRAVCGLDGGVFSALSQLTSLRDLCLAGVQGLDGKAFSAISLVESLEELYLQATETSHDSLSRLASGPCRKSLRILDLSLCPRIAEVEEDYNACRELAAKSFEVCDVLWPDRPQTYCRCLTRA